MSEYVHLVGMEGLQSAANRIKNAADEMNRAAFCYQNIFDQQRIFMNEWIERFKEILSEKEVKS